MNLSAKNTIGGIAAHSLAAVRILEEHGIDYCCGGQRRFDDVCVEKGFAPESLLAEIEAEEEKGERPARDWSKAPLKDLIAHIIATHHGYLCRELPLLDQRIAAVLAAHGQRHREILGPLA